MISFRNPTIRSYPIPPSRPIPIQHTAFGTLDREVGPAEGDLVVVGRYEFPCRPTLESDDGIGLGLISLSVLVSGS